MAIYVKEHFVTALLIPTELEFGVLGMVETNENFTESRKISIFLNQY